MMNIESSLWKVESFNDGYAHIIQKATGNMATVQRSKVPSANALAAMSEQRFDKILRDLFHDWS